MPKTKNKLQDYYAVVKLQTIIYFEAKDSEDAESVAEEIAGDMKVEICSLAPKKYQSTEIDIDDYEVTEIENHE